MSKVKRKMLKSSDNSNQIEQLQVDHPINNVPCIWHPDLDVKRTISAHNQVWGVLTGLWSKKS